MVMELVEQVLTDVYGTIGSWDEGDIVCTLASSTQSAVAAGADTTNTLTAAGEIHKRTSAQRINEQGSVNKIAETNKQYSHPFDTTQCRDKENSHVLDKSIDDNLYGENVAERSNLRTALGDRLQVRFGCNNEDGGRLNEENTDAANLLHEPVIVGKSNCKNVFVDKCHEMTLNIDGQSRSTFNGGSSCNATRQEVISSTPQMSGSSLANGGAVSKNLSFGSVSSICLTGNEQSALSEILSQPVDGDLPKSTLIEKNEQISKSNTVKPGTSSMPCVSTVNRKSPVATSVSCTISPSKIIYSGARSGPSSVASIVSVVGAAVSGVIDPQAWSRGHVYTEDGANIEVRLYS